MKLINIITEWFYDIDQRAKFNRAIWLWYEYAMSYNFKKAWEVEEYIEKTFLKKHINQKTLDNLIKTILDFSEIKKTKIMNKIEQYNKLIEEIEKIMSKEENRDYKVYIFHKDYKFIDLLNKWK